MVSIQNMPDSGKVVSTNRSFTGGTELAEKKLDRSEASYLRSLIERDASELSVGCQCELLGLSRSSY